MLGEAENEEKRFGGLGRYTALPEDPGWFPASISGSSQAPVSLDPRGADPLASADTCMRMYLSHVNTLVYIQLQVIF